MRSRGPSLVPAQSAAVALQGLLHAHFPMRQVNHQCAYRTDEGTTDNQAEPYFPRFRRMQIGQTHKFGIRYLANYAKAGLATKPVTTWESAMATTPLRIVVPGIVAPGPLGSHAQLLHNSGKM